MAQTKFPLPAVVDPPKRIYVCIPVPDVMGHRQAFMGALLNLAKWYSWQEDTAHTALAVARVWREIFDDVLDQLNQKLESCSETCPDPETPGLFAEDDMQLRIKPGDECIIQTLCGDGTWMDWYDPRGCIPGSVSQPEPVDQPAVGQCLEFDVKLDGNGLYHLPVPVSSLDTITITDARGGWWDGTVSPWHCPNGQSFFLGACVGSGGMSGTDPAPAINHMRLIASLDGDYVDAFNTAITIPQGLAATDLIFQANDSDLDDNKGSISFHVSYCHNNPTPAGDCLFDDFTDNDGGWTHVSSVADFGEYIATGTKHWQSQRHDGGGGVFYEQLRLEKAYVGHISTLRVTFDADQPGYFLFNNGSYLPDAFHALYLQQIVAGNGQVITATVDADAVDTIRFDFAHDLDPADARFRVYSIEVCP